MTNTAPERGMGLGMVLGRVKHSLLIIFMSSDCTHVQWMTYCEGAILSLTHSAVRFVTAGYAVLAPFKFSSKS